MNETQWPQALADDILRGSSRALSRGLTAVERGGDFADALMERLYPHTGKAHVVGITGSPGSGKSTLVRALARVARERKHSVGVVAIDPSSPFSGGSILGDRIRMNDVACEQDVFIRSLATHGALGGLCRAAADSVDVMDAAGRELIFLETVGIGQDEVDVMKAAATIVVVSVPGLGDEVQTLKAGVLEIADIHAVNKADREGAGRVEAELRSMLALGSPNEQAWLPPVFSCVASREEGVVPLFDAISRHLEFLHGSGEFDRRRKRMVKARVLGIAHELVNEATERAEYDSDDLFEQVRRRELAPQTAGRLLLKRLVGERNSATKV